MTGTSAIRGLVRGDAGALEPIVRRARELGITGWIRQDPEGVVRVHAEGEDSAVAGFVACLGGTVEVQPLAPEGHEQFAIRGVSAGAFVVQEHLATTRHFDFRLEVDGVMRSWAVPKGPSLDPAVKRLAVEVATKVARADFHPREAGARGVIVWDHGTYEQGGRVPWPEALARGHVVFVLHGEKLRGGFALQRTRPGAHAQWLLVKRRDDEARPGSDIVAEQPRSVLSGRTLDEQLAH